MRCRIDKTLHFDTTGTFLSPKSARREVCLPDLHHRRIEGIPCPKIPLSMLTYRLNLETIDYYDEVAPNHSWRCHRMIEQLEVAYFVQRDAQEVGSSEAYAPLRTVRIAGVSKILRE